MHICNENVKILNELPRWKTGNYKGKINRKAMIGMSLTIEYYGDIYEGIEIIDYIGGKNPNFIVKYNNKETNISCGHLLGGNFKNIVNHFEDLNNKEIIDGILHIHIVNKKGEEFTALYSGKHIDEVMNSNWFYSRGYARTSRYNQTKKRLSLHQIDLGDFTDHINNKPMDCRIENLRKSDNKDNSKNKNTNNKFGIVGIVKSVNGWYSCYKYKNGNVITKTKHDLEEVKIDALIAQRYLGYRHNEDMFYLLETLPQERIKEVEYLLDIKMKKANNKIHKEKEYDHKIIDCGEYKKLIKNEKDMLFDCDDEFIKNKCIYETNDYWSCVFVENGIRIENKFHKELFRLRTNEYNEYDLHIDHLNNDPDDNRLNNLAITTRYGNLCNKKGTGYCQRIVGDYRVSYIPNYKFWKLIGGIPQPLFKTKEEAIDEVNRRKKIVDKYRVKLKSKEELDELIEYCMVNNILTTNNQGIEIADLDLGCIIKNFGLKVEDIM